MSLMSCMVLAVLALIKLLFTMEINKITLNGVEYALTDKEAQQVAAFLSKRVDYLETATANLDKKIEANIGRIQLTDLDVDEVKEKQQQLNNRLSWAVFRDDGTVKYE